MLRMLISLVALTLLASPATAARSKADVSAAGCVTMDEARTTYKKGELRYRLISGKQCWYAPGKPMLRVAEPAHHATAATVGATRESKGAGPVTVVRAVGPAPTDDTTVVQEALCGGPCPRFDLNAPVYLALCGGPCPDFRRMKDPEVALNR